MPLQEYIVTKCIEAAPMRREDYEKCQSVIDSMLQDGSEHPSDEGYIIHHFDGYTSWVEKEIFESIYRKSGSMTFGHALKFLKLGSEVRRKSWNDKGMFLTLESDNDLTDFECIWMNTADDEPVPWTVSQEDVLAEDWEVL